MTDSPDISSSESAASSRTSHDLMISRIEFLGAHRAVDMHPGFNLVHGNITTGKTTFVRLLRALLGTVPDNLPQETERISTLLAVLTLGKSHWAVTRPLTTTRSAPVDVSEVAPPRDREPIGIRLPAAGSRASFGRFLLDHLNIPAVSVPQARSKPTEGLTPVTITDWLGYCIITGDELDSQVFGHQHPFRDQKRRWVFELAYGLYDAEVAKLAAQLRRVDNQINALEREEEIQGKFLANTHFSDREELERRIAEVDQSLISARETGITNAWQTARRLDVGELQESLLKTRSEARVLADAISSNQGQLQDLSDLLKQLKSQFSRLTRAVISDEWLVDFDFVVCPRCGNDISPTRADSHHCYLCLQPPLPAKSRDSFLVEQDRIQGQIQETESVISLRNESLAKLIARHQDLREQESRLSVELDSQTRSFVSDHAAQIGEEAAAQAYLEAERSKLSEYLHILDRFGQTALQRNALEDQKAEIEAAIEGREFSASTGEENIRALEARMLEYLERLHVPRFGDDAITVKINRKTYLPEISGRTFDELSSQGLKTLVNVAHALAHHTVAVDRGLPLPGFLALDGLSANAGREGFDEDRILDVYRLLVDVSDRYGSELQIVAVDNDPPVEILDEVGDKSILHLTQEDKLIRLDNPSPVTE